ncbi:hypothetical protein [Streptomyces bacillaris]|uniref:hypothetical protein n=1 Tax=Streptomyces bacillaris TaxID=68179 RepID=UPI003637CE1E
MGVSPAGVTTWPPGKLRSARDKTADRVFSDLYDPCIDGEVKASLSEHIAAYVAAPLERWCDITEDEEDISPGAAGILIDENSGPLIYFAMRWSMAEDVSAFAAAVADSMELVCFGVRQERLRPARSRAPSSSRRTR